MNIHTSNRRKREMIKSIHMGRQRKERKRSGRKKERRHTGGTGPTSGEPDKQSKLHPGDTNGDWKEIICGLPTLLKRALSAHFYFFL